MKRNPKKSVAVGKAVSEFLETNALPVQDERLDYPYTLDEFKGNVSYFFAKMLFYLDKNDFIAAAHLSQFITKMIVDMEKANPKETRDINNLKLPVNE